MSSGHRDLLDHERAGMDDELAVERIDPEAGIAPARPHVVSLRKTCAEGRIARVDARAQVGAVGHRVVIGGVREHRIALELRERERRRQSLSDPTRRLDIIA